MLFRSISVGLQYLAAWLGGSGAVAINNLMEDAATAEISRAQVWQWTRNAAKTAEGVTITADWIRHLQAEELARIEASMGASYARFRWEDASRLFAEVALGEEFTEFLTLPAYDLLD